jgi:hypothetical protein
MQAAEPFATGAHRLPQRPQFSGSSAKATQAGPQRSRGLHKKSHIP